MILGIDIDDTITNTSKVVNKYLRQEYPEYDNRKLLSKKEYQKFLKKHIRQMRDEYELKDGVKTAWEYFKENHFKIIIITARNNKYDRNNIKNTKAFLKKNGLFYDKIYFRQIKKGRKAYKEHVDLFIDDKERVLDNVALYQIPGVCMGISSKYQSFSNWYQLLDYIKEVNNGRRENIRCE